MKKMTIAALVFLTLSACKENNVHQASLRSVQTVAPEVNGTTALKTYSGIVQEAHQTKVGFKTPGQIQKIYVKEGDRIVKGQLLAELDSKDYQLGVEALQIQYDQMQREAARMDEMFAEKAVSQNDYEKFNAGMKQLGVQLQVNKNKLEYTRLYAPSDGYVLRVNNNPSELVDAGTPVFDLLDVSHMEVLCDVPASQYVDRNNIIRYYGKTNYTGDQQIPMQFLSLTPKADGNQLYQLRLSFGQTPDSRITAGMNIEICLQTKTPQTEGKITVPMHAVFQREGNEFVWVLNADSTVSSRKVEMSGIDDDGDAVIVSGLTGEETIVRAGANTLQEGEKVKVISVTTETNVGGML